MYKRNSFQIFFSNSHILSNSKIKFVWQVVVKFSKWHCWLDWRMVQFLPTSMCDTMAQSSKTGCWKLVQCVPSHFMSETQYTRGLVKCGNNSWQLPNMTFCHFQPKCVLQSDAMRHHFSVTKGTLESVCHLSEFKNPLPLRIISSVSLCGQFSYYALDLKIAP